MAPVDGPFAGAGSPKRRQRDLSLAQRVGSWLVWWVLLMSFWVWADNSIGLAELVGGAAAAAFGALLTEVVQHQADSRIRIRIQWLAAAYKLPYEVCRDTLVVFAALWRRITRGEEPDSGFEEIPVRWGDESPEGVTRRTLLIGATSLAPNTFALGIDPEREVMVVHRLVVSSAKRQTQSGAKR
ncbi:MAG: Na+/H+ antiporter subunit E [Acidimicrobiales bacterium]